MKSLLKDKRKKSIEKPILRSGTRSYEEIVKVIKSIKKELEAMETSTLNNENLRVL